MRRIAPLLLCMFVLAFLFAVPSILPAHASIGYVGGAINAGGSVTSLSLTYSSSTGNTAFVMFIWRCNAGAITVTVSDTGGSTYVRRQEVQPDAFRCVDMYSTSAGGSVASTSFSLSLSASTPMIVAAVEEYLDINSLGNTFSNGDWTGSCGTCVATITTTLSGASDFAIAFASTPDAGSGWSANTGNMRHQKDNAGNGGLGTVDNTGSTSVVTALNAVSGGIRWEMLSIDAQVPPPPDFALTNDAPASGVVIVDGGTGTIHVSASKINGGSLSVTFSCVSPPTGISCSFSPASCGTPCTATLTVSVGATVNSGFYTLTIQGQAPGPITHTTTAMVHVVDQLSAAGVGLAAFAIVLVLAVAYFLYSGGRRKRRKR